MGEERLKSLLNYLKETPQDPFLLYAIATEYRSASPEKSKEYFEQLMTDFPDYLPAYYQAAHLYWEMGEHDLTIRTFEKGIGVAREQKETKTLAELQNAYMNFQIEED